MDGDAINSMLHDCVDPKVYRVKVGSVVYKSQLEAKWAAEFARSMPDHVAVYEKAKYKKVWSPRFNKFGREVSESYRPDFVLIPNGSELSRSHHKYRCFPHVEVKPTRQSPPNLLHLVGAPVVLLCGYPDDADRSAWIVFSESYRPPGPGVTPRRAFYPFGTNYRAAFAAWFRGEFDAMLHDPKTVTDIRSALTK